METGTIVIIAIIVVAVVVIAGGIAIAARSSLLPGRRTTRLKKRFGAEYDHAVEAHGDAAAAERDLSERLRHRKNMKLRKLSDQQRAAHTDTWAVVQQEFVDDPVRSVRSARGLVEAIMIDRGYPDRPADTGDTSGFESRLRDLSVDHPAAVAEFRRVHASGRPVEADQTGTEHMREELVAYRGLVEGLLGELPAADGTDHRTAPRPRAATDQPQRDRGPKTQR
ncbi:hypothetical protein A6A08_02630 [Nocardiopsis sp. TSRI0078]|uniref:hypothetical protein n=1 Tax=unclassified Nocardiopsis TaxID=2649073 RepID=UPI00093B40DE|nr:hypothetical protein [Nocardiopsis sp. TSRI0078]OKI23682.1 hypothetical protein A6A08_02630 [Nocardiopsis sp. TSRI0078]